jgi:putative two-component system response regulator
MAMSKGVRARILVVDSEPLVRALLARVLKDSGWEVQTVPDALRALAALAEREFALAMVDLKLPGMSGRDLAAVIAERWPETAVVISAAMTDTRTAVACMQAGAYDYLTKPFDLDDLLVRLDRALERRRLMLESQQQQRALEVGAKRQTRAARRLFLGAIRSLSSALEAKDWYTRGHSERVSRSAAEIAQAFGAGRDELRCIRLAGQLHDIGKIGVREEILAKPGPLTEEERRHMQIHPVVGERILAPTLIEGEIVRMVRHHHEWYSGGGYPDGLAGSAIPFGARVLAVADAFDALTSDRPYRPRLTWARALEVLRAGAGTQWQPGLVEALVHRVKATGAEGSPEAGREAGASGEGPASGRGG